MLPPPPANLPVVEKAKSVYKHWLVLKRNLPRGEQFGIGAKIDRLFLEVLENLRYATFNKNDQKILLLSEALVKIDSTRFFIQLCWEAKLIANKHYLEIGLKIEELGRMVGGWRKGYLTKTSPPTGGEEKK